MPNTIDRFSNRVENYVRYRPGYPPEIIAYLKESAHLTAESIVADVGCGTGISSRLFLENGNRVIGIEPNAAMRAAAIEELAAFPGFTAVDGTSDVTTLPENSVDMIVAAQAFHWFDPGKTRPEFERILKPGAQIVLIWNERQLDSTPFLVEYEALLIEHSIDYQRARHENVDQMKLGRFLGEPFGTATFQNLQAFDFEGLKGRLLSSSYMPDEMHENYESMIAALQAVFAKHAENDRIKVLYDTNVYHTLPR